MHVRAMFIAYLVFIFGGIAYALVIGVLHQ
jgi:hypothetical protein